MPKINIIIICILLISSNIFSQNNNFHLNGKIVDDKNNALQGASILLKPINKGTTSNLKGNYIIDGLKKSKYVIEISFIGYKNLTDTILIEKNTVYNASLTTEILSLQEIVISDNSNEINKKQQSLNVEIVNNTYLKENMGGSLSKSLARLPGVSTMDIGTGQSKPVIRGLGFNRVVVVENGIKHEGQQWGADHGLEIDQFAVDDIEVVKGPSSLMYGSDAIAGVIDVKQNKIPLNNTINANIDLIGKSNNNLLGSSILFSTRKNWFFLNLRATYINYADYKVPTDSVDIYSYKAALYKNQLRNTAGFEKDFHLVFGIIKDKFSSKFFLSSVNSKNGFFANAHGLEPRNVNTQIHDEFNRDILFPYQEFKHYKIINKNKWSFNNLKIEADLGFQNNFRQEWSEYVNHGYMPATFPDSLIFPANLELQFNKNIYSCKIITTYSLSENTNFSAGLNAEYQQNMVDGRGFIIPAFTQTNYGIFALVKQVFSQTHIVQIGIRYDLGNIATESYNDWFLSPNETNISYSYLQRAEKINRNFSNFTYSLGYNYNLEKIALKINAGKSFRMPIAKELAANGVNYHNFSYEVGNSNIKPEISYQLDAGFEVLNKKFAFGATPFLNYFSNYIYLNPSSQHDRLYGNGNQSFYYTESEVLRYGAEIHSHYQLFKNIKLGFIGEYVYSEQLSGEKKGYTIPFSPPTNVLFNVKYSRNSITFVQKPYLSIDYILTATQKNIVPPEEITEGFQLINIRFGGDLKVKNSIVKISMQIQNILNTKYFNHTSYYRLINVPESGRNFIINISIPISLKIKSELKNV